MTNVGQVVPFGDLSLFIIEHSKALPIRIWVQFEPL